MGKAEWVPASRDDCQLWAALGKSLTTQGLSFSICKMELTIIEPRRRGFVVRTK